MQTSTIGFKDNNGDIYVIGHYEKGEPKTNIIQKVNVAKRKKNVLTRNLFYRRNIQGWYRTVPAPRARR
jgi:hypothetical protein